MCKETKLVTDFHKSNQRAGARTKTRGFVQSRCKKCQAKDRDFYKQRNKFFVQKEKLRRGCADCGYNKHPFVLDFHHINPEEKLFGLASRHAAGCPLEKLTIEMNKCEVLCANCHRTRHFLRGNHACL